jgi:hypothetical protein
MTSDQRNPPGSLDRRRRALWRAIVADYELSDAEYQILEDALRLTQRADEAANIVNDEGVTIADRYGTPKTHPAVDVELRCRVNAARLLRQLHVELPDHAVPRPSQPGPRKRLRAA